MHNIKKFSEFINEGRYDNTWHGDITQAKALDKEFKGYKKNMSDMHHVSPHMIEYSKEHNTEVPHQRELVIKMNPHMDWSKASDKEIVRYINTEMKIIRLEAKNRAINSKIEKELERLYKNQGIRINAHANCPDHQKIKFVKPIFKTKEDLEFLKVSDRIEVNAEPTVVNNWEVEYSGTVENDNNDIMDFSGINNGLSVQLG